MNLKPEQIDHINLYNWFCHEFPELSDDFHHFANERYFEPKKNGAHFLAGRTLKRMGVKKGVADFHLAFPQNEHHGLWIELKVNGGILSSEQKDFLARKRARGYSAIADWGEEAAKETILYYLRDHIAERLRNAPKKQYNSRPIC